LSVMDGPSLLTYAKRETPGTYRAQISSSFFCLAAQDLNDMDQDDMCDDGTLDARQPHQYLTDSSRRLALTTIGLSQLN